MSEILPTQYRRHIIRIDEKGWRNAVIYSNVKDYSSKEWLEDERRKKAGLDPIDRTVLKTYVACQTPKVRYFWRDRNFFGRDCNVVECEIRGRDIVNMECDLPEEVSLIQVGLGYNKYKFNELSQKDRDILNSIQVPYEFGHKR